MADDDDTGFVTVLRKTPRKTKAKPAGAQGGLVLYHGTSWKCGREIQASGFKASSEGELGAGVYFAKEGTAKRYALASEARGKGFGAMVLVVRVHPKTMFTATSASEMKAWDAYDGCHCPRMFATDTRTKNKLTAGAEWCFKESTPMTIIAAYEVEPMDNPWR